MALANFFLLSIFSSDSYLTVEKRNKISEFHIIPDISWKTQNFLTFWWYFPDNSWLPDLLKHVNWYYKGRNFLEKGQNPQKHETPLWIQTQVGRQKVRNQFGSVNFRPALTLAVLNADLNSQGSESFFQQKYFSFKVH